MTEPLISKAAVLYQPKEPVMIEELEVPALLPGQALVKMAYSGICQTQLLEVRGKKGVDRYLPHALGHEGSGWVLAVGNGVSRVKNGDSVVLSWIKGAGQDAPGPKYKNKKDQTINAGQVATFCQYAVVSENRCTPIDKRLPMRTAALLGCAIPTGAGIVVNQLAPQSGQSVMVIGTGGIGLSAILAAKHRNCSPIVAVDVTQQKLHFARQLGASHTINALEEKVEESLYKICREGVDFAIEASGQRVAMESGLRCVREKGGKLIIAGNLSHGEKISLDPFDLIKGRNIVGTWGGQTIPEKDIPHYTDLNLKGEFPFEKLIGKTYALEEINQAFEDLERGCLGRLLIEFP